jgi:hypothetical protein
VVGCEPVEVQGKTGLLMGVGGWVFCKVGGWGLKGLVGGYVGVMVGGGSCGCFMACCDGCVPVYLCV